VVVTAATTETAVALPEETVTPVAPKSATTARSPDISPANAVSARDQDPDPTSKNQTIILTIIIVVEVAAVAAEAASEAAATSEAEVAVTMTATDAPDTAAAEVAPTTEEMKGRDPTVVTESELVGPCDQ
jgi:hypothetical protein